MKSSLLAALFALLVLPADTFGITRTALIAEANNYKDYAWTCRRENLQDRELTGSPAAGFDAGQSSASSRARHAWIRGFHQMQRRGTAPGCTSSEALTRTED